MDKQEENTPQAKPKGSKGWGIAILLIGILATFICLYLFWLLVFFVRMEFGSMGGGEYASRIGVSVSGVNIILSGTGTGIGLRRYLMKDRSRLHKWGLVLNLILLPLSLFWYILWLHN